MYYFRQRKFFYLKRRAQGALDLELGDHALKKMTFPKSFSLKKLGQAVGACTFIGWLAFSGSVQAAHGSYNPMMPRQLSQEAAMADYTYGYSVLSGHAIDTLDAPNRAMWFVNYDIFDHYILRPIAHGYAFLPQGVQNSVGNFFNNLSEVNNIPNNLLVGEPKASAVSFSRLVVNSTIGILGLFDVASQIGLEAAPMEMQTVLGKAGVEQGPFMMIPAYGPTTARDLHGDTVDGLAFMWMSWPVTIGKWALQGIHNRAQMIPQEGVIDNAIDPYVQTRDVFLMYDENKVNPVAEGEIQSDDGFDESLLDEIDG